MNEILSELITLLPHVAAQVAIAVLPVVFVFWVYQITLLKLPKSKLISMSAGMAYSYIGLVLFFLGLDIGFIETGTELGLAMGALPNNWVLVPIGVLIGLTVVLAEPAVRSLVRQVRNVSEGMISQGAVYLSLSAGVAVSVGLAMARAIWGINFWYVIVPGYIIALVLAKFTPPLFTAIAFDSGGVASGPMTSTFVLSFAVGVTTVVGKMTHTGDAFGVVALVAMTPLITIQILGLIYKAKQARTVYDDEEEEAEDDV